MSSQYPNYPRTGSDRSTGREEPTRTGVGAEQTRGGAVTHRGEEGLGRARERISTAAETVKEKAHDVTSYLKEQDLAEMADEMANVIRRYPMQSMLVGLGIGFMLGRVTSR